MKENMVPSLLNEHIASAFADGYGICYDIRGSYSNVMGYTVLAKGNERMVFWVEKDNEKVGDEFMRVDTLFAKVGKVVLKDGETMERNHCWPKEWGCLWERKFYNVTWCLGTYWLVENLDEVIAANELRHNRWHALNDGTSNGAKYFDITPSVLKAARKVEGFKRIAADNLVAYKLRGKYYIRNKKSGREHMLG